MLPFTSQIDHPDLSHKAYLQIKSMILRNEFKPGEKLAQEQLAYNLGISRMPLHKAFQMLENEMLVESVPRRGIFVKKVNLLEIADAFECREAIEGIAARRVAESINKTELEQLFELFSPFASDPANADLIKYQEADNTFHNLIISYSNNKVLARMEVLANILVQTYRTGLVRPPEHTFPEHMAIIEALKSKNGELAEQLIRKHFALSREVILSEYYSNKEASIANMTDKKKALI